MCFMIFFLAFKCPSARQCVCCVVPAPLLECLSFTLQEDVCAEFDTKRFFSCSSAKRRKLLCAHIKTYTYSHDLWYNLCGSQSWSSMQLRQVWCGNLKPLLHLRRWSDVWDIVSPVVELLKWAMFEYLSSQDFIHFSMREKE